ncbi:Zinc finger protein Pegasus [Cichlidogyrus casuarinus]|uniref:Zinc finger protein Pegasus n=1 Tax=Cichlidogyrus casuarinus TaxID=1844966 RepID=A0ABD2Q5L2_9PLAT
MKREFDCHLQTHYDYRCEKCDYKSRTEGRLKRHIKDFHSTTPPDSFSGKNAKLMKPKIQKCKQCNFHTEIKASPLSLSLYASFLTAPNLI